MAFGHHSGQHQASPYVSWELQVRVQQRGVAVLGGSSVSDHARVPRPLPVGMRLGFWKEMGAVLSQRWH